MTADDSRRPRIASRLFQMASRRLQTGSRWLQMAPDGGIRWLQTAPNGSRWLQPGPGGSRQAQTAPKGFQMAPDSCKWLQVARDESRWLQVAPDAKSESLRISHKRHVIVVQSYNIHGVAKHLFANASKLFHMSALPAPCHGRFPFWLLFSNKFACHRS